MKNERMNLVNQYNLAQQECDKYLVWLSEILKPILVNVYHKNILYIESIEKESHGLRVHYTNRFDTDIDTQLIEYRLFLAEDPVAENNLMIQERKAKEDQQRDQERKQSYMDFWDQYLIKQPPKPNLSHQFSVNLINGIDKIMNRE